MIRAHQTSLYISQLFPPEVEAGTGVALKVQVSCARGCDLRGHLVHVVASDDLVTSGELTRHDDTMSETGEITLQVPEQVGEYAWSVVFPRHDTEDSIHEESVLPLRFKTIPHAISIAVWDVPSRVPIAGPLQVKVGVRCSAGCQLTGCMVEIDDETGAKVGEGRLGDTPWAGTNALYWTVIELSAPATEDMYFRTVACAVAGIELPHEGATTAFSFRTDKARDHCATVRVIEESTRTPVGDVEVRVGPYMASTNERGVAKVALPKGTFEVSIRKDGFQAQPFSVAVNEDLAVDVEAVTVPTRAEMGERIFDDYPWG